MCYLDYFVHYDTVYTVNATKMMIGIETVFAPMADLVDTNVIKSTY